MEQSPSWEDSSGAAGHEIPYLLLKLKFHYRGHKIPSLYLSLYMPTFLTKIYNLFTL
jgi:hypothetical protein